MGVIKDDSNIKHAKGQKSFFKFELLYIHPQKVVVLEIW